MTLWIGLDPKTSAPSSACSAQIFPLIDLSCFDPGFRTTTCHPLDDMPPPFALSDDVNQWMTLWIGLDPKTSAPSSACSARIFPLIDLSCFDPGFRTTQCHPLGDILSVCDRRDDVNQW